MRDGEVKTECLVLQPSEACGIASHRIACLLATRMDSSRFSPLLLNCLVLGTNISC